MDKRKRIGLFFSYDENWIGGSYYILNLIEALKLLPEDRRPQITIFYSDNKDAEKVRDLGYPYIKFLQIPHNSFIKKGINFLYRKIAGVNLYNLSEKIPYKYFDAIFPMPFSFSDRISKKIIYWIPDFQEAHLPHFFSPEELIKRKTGATKIAKSNKIVVFSSYDTQKDFKALYPDSNVKQAVVQFAVTHPGYGDIDFNSLMKKYLLPQEYFFCPNQFWVHKNQKIILEAIALLKHNHNKNIRVVFSGKNYDSRNIHYFNDLETYIRENNIEGNVSFLGFIDRKEQLLIMKNAIAVLQPSLFEGWSTVIEDAKAMDQNIITSDIEVHKEQLGEDAIYFSPTNVDSLVRVLMDFKKRQIKFDYDENRLKFADTFINIIDE